MKHDQSTSGLQENSVGVSTAMVPSVDVLSAQLELDYDFIYRNVRDLASTAQFKGMDELQELHTLAYNNLKVQLQPDKPLALDPSLVLEAYRTLSSVVMTMVETKRKAADTLMKARALVDLPQALLKEKQNNSIVQAADAFSEDLSRASLSSDSGYGVYGNLLGQSSDPKDVAVDPLASV